MKRLFKNLFEGYDDYGTHGYIIVMQLIKLLIEKKIITLGQADELMKVPETKKK